MAAIVHILCSSHMNFTIKINFRVMAESVILNILVDLSNLNSASIKYADTRRQSSLLSAIS